MPSLLELSRELAAIAQAGLAYSKDPFDIGRFHRVREIAGEVLAGGGIPDFEWPAEPGYPTPKVDVRGAIFQGETVLLVLEKASGLWTLPGGWADVNLSPKENIEREVREETGYLAEAVHLSAILDRERAGYPPNAHSIFKIFFVCKIVGGSPRPSEETEKIAFFPLNALPPLDPNRASETDIRHAFSASCGKRSTARFN